MFKREGTRNRRIWIIGSQAPNRGRFNDQCIVHVPDQAFNGSGKRKASLGDDQMVCSL